MYLYIKKAFSIFYKFMVYLINKIIIPYKATYKEKKVGIIH